MAFTISINIDTTDSEQDFYNQIVADNEGEAVQTLAKGKLLDFLSVTDEQKKTFALGLLSRDFTQRYNNAQVEKAVTAFRAAELEKRQKGEK